MPWIVGWLVIIGACCGNLGLLAGFLSRVTAASFLVIMQGAFATTHLSHGFFMNWFSQQFYKEVHNDNPGDTSRWI